MFATLATASRNNFVAFGGLPILTVAYPQDSLPSEVLDNTCKRDAPTGGTYWDRLVTSRGVAYCPIFGLYFEVPYGEPGLTLAPDEGVQIAANRHFGVWSFEVPEGTAGLDEVMDVLNDLSDALVLVSQAADVGSNLEKICYFGPATYGTRTVLGSSGVEVHGIAGPEGDDVFVHAPRSTRQTEPPANQDEAATNCSGEPASPCPMRRSSLLVWRFDPLLSGVVQLCLAAMKALPYAELDG